MMATPATGLIAVLILFVLLLAGVRIGVALGLVGLGGLALILGPEAAVIKSGVVVVETLTRYELGTLPLFLLMAQIFFAADASRDLFDAAARFVGHRRGGLAYAAVGGCAGFGAINGSSLATAATVGMVALPEMRQRGYADTLATGSVAAGGTLGALVPPSIPLIFYALLTEQSIGILFVAAVVPAFIAIVFYMTTAMVYVRLYPETAPERAPRATGAELWAAVNRVPIDCSAMIP